MFKSFFPFIYQYRKDKMTEIYDTDLDDVEEYRKGKT